MIGALALIAAAGAQEPVPPAPSPEDALPVAVIRASFLSGVPDLIGVNGSLVLAPFAIEAGASTMFFLSGYHARAGLALPAYVNDDATVAILLSPMAGYRYFVTIPFDTSFHVHGATLTVATDLVLWLGAVGLDLQLTLGAEAIVEAEAGYEPTWLPDARLAVGLAF